MIYNLGSINADYFYNVPHIPAPGETLAATSFSQGMGGKGANQSVAIARAGGAVSHIGAVGSDGAWMVERLRFFGVQTDYISTLNRPSGHAMITVATDGENAITLFSGANQMQSGDRIAAALEKARPGDWLILQNETNGQKIAAEIARSKEMKIAYSAAPFDVAAVQDLLPLIDLLVVNEGEAAALRSALNLRSDFDIPVPKVLITYGPKGASLHETHQGTKIDVPGVEVTAVDTTGAGDTFFGFFIAALDRGDQEKVALAQATRAAALKVTRSGTADAIPNLAEVEAFQP